jgi:hypothetical protein
MILYIKSDASYLSEKRAKIRAGGFFYMGSSTKTDKKPTNRAILIISKVLKHVMSSAAEAEIGAVFYKCQGRSSPSNNIRRIRAPSAPISMETDNTTATGYSNGTIKQKRTKAMDMRFYWIKDRVKQGQFNVYWARATKIWQIISQNIIRQRIIKIMREIYIHANEHPLNRKGIRDSALPGCVNNSGKAGA